MSRQNLAWNEFSRTRVKVCCISSIDDAEVAVRAGADAIGLVGQMPSGPGTIDDNLIAVIAQSVPPGIDTFLLTSETDPGKVVEHVLRCGTSVVQLVDRVPTETYLAVKAACPGVRIVQVVHVESQAAVSAAQTASKHVDAILLDSGCPGATVPELGGTGRSHDWYTSAEIVRSVELRVYLAGGLNPENACRAIEQVHPLV